MTEEVTWACWNALRRSLTHDWMKNRFSVGLRAIQCLLSASPHSEYVFDSLAQSIDSWHSVVGDWQKLIESLPIAASPKLMFRLMPLAGLDSATREWLEKYTHDRWMGRHDITRQQEDGRRLISEVSRVCGELRRVIEGRSDTQGLLHLVHCLGQAAERLESIADNLPRQPTF